MRRISLGFGLPIALSLSMGMLGCGNSNSTIDGGGDQFVDAAPQADAMTPPTADAGPMAPVTLGSPEGGTMIMEYFKLSDNAAAGLTKLFGGTTAAGTYDARIIAEFRSQFTADTSSGGMNLPFPNLSGNCTNIITGEEPEATNAGGPTWPTAAAKSGTTTTFVNVGTTYNVIGNDSNGAYTFKAPLDTTDATDSIGRALGKNNFYQMFGAPFADNASNHLFVPGSWYNVEMPGDGANAGVSDTTFSDAWSPFSTTAHFTEGAIYMPAAMTLTTPALNADGPSASFKLDYNNDVTTSWKNGTNPNMDPNDVLVTNVVVATNTGVPVLFCINPATGQGMAQSQKITAADTQSFVKTAQMLAQSNSSIDPSVALLLHQNLTHHLIALPGATPARRIDLLAFYCITQVVGVANIP